MSCVGEAFAQSNTVTWSTASAWLDHLGLSHLITWSAFSPDQSFMSPLLSVAEVQPWARACYLTAYFRRQAFGGDLPEDFAAWRGFVLLLELDGGTRDAIDTLMRLNVEETKIVYEVGLLFDEYRAKLADAPVMKRVHQRQVARARRMTGQGPGDHKRPSEAAFWKESLPPKVRR